MGQITSFYPRHADIHKNTASNGSPFWVIAIEAKDDSISIHCNSQEQVDAIVCKLIREQAKLGRHYCSFCGTFSDSETCVKADAEALEAAREQLQADDFRPVGC
jgi:hypothetical protein